MNDYQVLEELSKTDAYAPGTLMPGSAWSRDTALSEIERRMGMEERESTKQAAVTRPGQHLQQTTGPSGPGRAFETPPQKPAPARRFTAAAAVLVLIVGIGTWAVVGGDRDTGVDPETAAVRSAIEARNRGDIDEYLARLTGAALTLERDIHVAEAMSYANHRTELADCRVTGEAATGESLVECESTSRDDFYGAGGIVESGNRTFFVTDDLRISGSDLEGPDIPWEETEVGMFNRAFWSWLIDAHPTVFAEIGPSPGPALPEPLTPDSIPGLNWPANYNFGVDDFHEADEMLVALAYVDEFVAQSDVYPISR